VTDSEIINSILGQIKETTVRQEEILVKGSQFSVHAVDGEWASVEVKVN
jgi:hypothetical protein